MKAIKKNKSTADEKPKVMVVTPEEEQGESPEATPQVSIQSTASVPQRTASGIEIVDEIGDVPTRNAPTVIPASIRDADTLEIVFLEEQFDYPVIGRFNFQTVFGVTRIRKHQKFVVPRPVALTLYDKHLVSIPGLE